MKPIQYDQLRGDAIRAYQERCRQRGWHLDYTHAVDIAGVRFALHVIRQSLNGHRAGQVLHYVDGKKVGQRSFRDALSQLSMPQTPAGLDDSNALFAPSEEQIRDYRVAQGCSRKQAIADLNATAGSPA